MKQILTKQLLPLKCTGSWPLLLPAEVPFPLPLLLPAASVRLPSWSLSGQRGPSQELEYQNIAVPVSIEALLNKTA